MRMQSFCRGLVRHIGDVRFRFTGAIAAASFAVPLLVCSMTMAETRAEFEDGIEVAESALASQNYATAAKQLKQTILVGRKILGTDHADVGAAYALLGDAYAGLGRPATAQQYFELATDIMARSLAADEPRLRDANSRLRELKQRPSSAPPPDLFDRWEKKGWISNNYVHVATGIKAPASIQRFRRLPDDLLPVEERGRYIVYQNNDKPVPITVRVSISNVPAADAKFEVFAFLDLHSEAFGRQSPFVDLVSMKKSGTRAHGYVTRWRTPATGDDEDLMEEAWVFNWNDIEMRMRVSYMDFSSHTAQHQAMFVVGEFGTQLTGATLRNPAKQSKSGNDAERNAAGKGTPTETSSGPTDDAMR